MRNQPSINDIRKFLITFFSLLPQIESVFLTDISVIMPVDKVYYFIWLTQCLRAKSLQSCRILNDSLDCSLPGSSVQGALQARILEWVAISFSRGPFQTRNKTQVSCIAGSLLNYRIIFQLNHQGSLVLTQVN